MKRRVKVKWVPPKLTVEEPKGKTSIEVSGKTTYFNNKEGMVVQEPKTALMGAMIRDMEFPSCCARCKIVKVEHVPACMGAISDELKCPLTGKYLTLYGKGEFDIYSQRDDECPLIQGTSSEEG